MNWRERLHEDNKLLFEMWGGWCSKVYLSVAFSTFIFQMRDRFLTCEGQAACVMSFAKGGIWASVWPFYWINWATNFVCSIRMDICRQGSSLVDRLNQIE